MDQTKSSAMKSILCLLSLWTCVIGTPLLPLCEMGYFYDMDTQSCTACSECPLNHIIRQPCTSVTDTVCGPFYEFEFFNQGASNSKPKKGKEVKSDFNLFKVDSTKQPSVPDMMKKAASKDIIQTEGPSIHDETTKWKELCYGLIAALVVLAIIFTAYVVIAQVQISRLHTKAKESSVPENDEETIYCYTHLCTGQPQPNKPQISTASSQQGLRLPPIYRPGQARRVITNVPLRASPNEYVLQNNNTAQKKDSGDSLEQSSSSSLLPVIPEGEHTDNCDHVRVLYTN